jgi:hypothetical protein
MIGTGLAILDLRFGKDAVGRVWTAAAVTPL